MGKANSLASAAGIASGHREVTGAAAEILRAGGNAFDAAVGAGMASCIAEPCLTSLAGGGFLLAHTRDGEDVLFDFFVDTPGLGLASTPSAPDFRAISVPFGSADQIFHIGMASAGVPGVLAGYAHVHRRLGRLSLAEVVAPATRLARRGVALNRSQAFVNRILGPIGLDTPGARAIFAPGGELLGEGDVIRSEEMADFLESFARDGATFYAGAFADAIDRDMRAGAGLLTREDLAAYRVIEREPLRFGHAGREVLTNPAPSFGGTLIAMAVRIADGAGEGSLPSSERLAALVEVQREVERLRAAPGGAQDLSDASARVRRSTGGTTHVSVIDAEGNAASMTTSNGQGCGYVVPGTGVMMNNMMGEDDLFPEGFHSEAPGVRVASMMSPTIVLEEGRAALALGSGGSKRIRTAIAGVLTGVLDLGLGVREAIDAPRAHWDGQTAQLEPGFDPGAVAALGRRAPVRVWDSPNVYFGGVHAVAAGPGGRIEAAGDPRREGSSALVPAGPGET